MNTLRTIVAAMTLLISYSSLAQNQLADSLRSEGLLDAAIIEYKDEFKKDKSNTQNIYDLAAALALTYQKDKVFYYLEFALAQDSSLWVLADPDMIGMIGDPRWKQIETQQLEKYQQAEGSLADPEYAAQLCQIIMKDQALDYQIHMARKFYMQNGTFPHWHYPVAKMKQEIGADNFNTMQRLLEENGWPKYSTVGDLAADAVLLVINHHESDAVREQYLEIIREHCLMGEGNCMEYAKIHDRILVNSNQLQTYGMQFRFKPDRTLEPFPIKDPETVDRRRAEIGLEPIKDYLKRKIDYDWTVVQK